jgi:hypothetical protein
MTIYVKVDEGHGRNGPPRLDWHPWINCQEGEREMTVRLALNKWLRERGGVSHDETLYATVWSFTDKDERWPSGEPKTALTTTFKVTKE